MTRVSIVPLATRRLRQTATAGLLSASLCALAGCATSPNLIGPMSTGNSASDVQASDPGERAAAGMPSPARQQHSEVPLFSTASSGDAIPLGWENWVLHPRKKATRYEIVIDSGKPVLRAHATASASGLLARLDVDPSETPVIEWSWRAESLLSEADNLVAALEDSPARIVLAFEGDRSLLPLKEQLFFERVKLFTGVDLPFATLMYIWGNRKPIDSLLQSPHTQRIQKIVVSSGSAGVKRWHRMRRNIVEDYRRAFGKSPGRLVGVAVMSDSDNTNGEVVAYYGDIRLLRRSIDLRLPIPRAADRDDRLERREFGG